MPAQNTPANPPMPKVENQSSTQSVSNTGAHEYASVGRRFLAALVDGILVGVVVGILTLPFSGGSLESQSLIYQAVSWILGSAYLVYFTAKSGQTIGKKALGIKVIKLETTNHPDMNTAVMREVVGKLVSGVVLGLGYLWALWDKQKQTWHDKIAGTVVVKV